jgi:hypothetical protein
MVSLLMLAFSVTAENKSSIRQHTSAYVSIRQHTSAYVSIRQHTSAYVSIAFSVAAENKNLASTPRDTLCEAGAFPKRAEV